MPTSELDTTSWAAFESSLALCLGRLGDHEFVTVADGTFVPEPAPKRGLLGRVFGGGEPADGGAFVQAQPSDGLLYAECVGSISFGGRHAFTSEQEEGLERLGWVHRPDGTGERST